MSRRYKPEHYLTPDQASRLYLEAEQFEETGKLPRTAELRMFAKGIFNNDDISTLGMMTKLIYRRLAQRLMTGESNQAKDLGASHQAKDFKGDLT